MVTNKKMSKFIRDTNSRILMYGFENEMTII